jgi:hypothetical protein
MENEQHGRSEDNESPIIWASSYFDESAYNLGLQSKDNDNNPFNQFTNKWFNWNRGYNMRTPKIDNRKSKKFVKCSPINGYGCDCVGKCNFHIY